MAARMNRPLVLDGRNLFAAGELERHGFEYHGMGRRAPRLASAPVVP
jgi:hypothetical protein